MPTLPLPALLATLLHRLRPASAAAARNAATTPATPSSTTTAAAVAPPATPPATTWLAPCGTLLTLQPLHPRHAPLLGAFFDGLSPAARRQRFHAAVRGPSPERLAWLASPDFLSRGGCVVTRQVSTGHADAHTNAHTAEVLAEGMWVRGSTPGTAEFALCVADAWQRQGLGKRLLRSLADGARRQGLQQLHGDVLPGNPAMLALAGSLQFGWGNHPEEPGLLRVTRTLSTAPTEAPTAAAATTTATRTRSAARWQLAPCQAAAGWLAADWFDTTRGG